MQKKVGNALYVFDTTPFTITEDTNAEVIYVQNECLKGYLELNTELESKIKTFNQWLLCVNAPWADTGTSEPTQNYHLLTIPGYNEEKPLYVYGYDNNTLPGNSSTDWFHVINEKQRIAGMIDAAVTDKIYCNTGAEVFIRNEPDEFETITGLNIINNERFGDRYGFVMGDSDMTVEYSYTLKPTYNINFSADSNANTDVTIYPYDRKQFAGKTALIWFNNDLSSSTIEVTSVDAELSHDNNIDRYRFIMPEHDVTIKAVYKPIDISIELGDTDLTYRSDTPYDPSGTYYPHTLFIVQVPEGKTTDNYTFVKSDDKIAVNPVNDHFDMEFKVSGTVTFANA